MAYTGGKFFVIVELMDNGANLTRKRYQLRSSTPSGAATDAGLFVAALAAVTNANLIRYMVEEAFDSDNVDMPGEGVQIENQALVDFAIAGSPGKTAIETIPAPIIGIFTAADGAGANVVDVNDALFLAWSGMFANDGKLFISDGEDSGGAVRGKRIHRKSSRG